MITLIIVSLLMTVDLFLHSGKHITFDGHIHMTTMAQFATAIKDGEFPVTWSNNFANYGLPLAIFAHQLPAYLGAILILLGVSVVGAYNLIMFFAVLLSTVSFYLFAKKYVQVNQALLASVLMNLFPYRIHNIYIRGGLPEIFASVFYPLILLSIYQFNKKKKKKSLIILTLLIFLLAITHPMMLLIFAIPSALYFLITLEKQQWRKKTIFMTIAVILGVGLASYYLLPLLMEMKYFYQGTNQTVINQEQFFNLNNFFSSQWYYFFAHPGPRGNFIKFGLPEIVIVFLSLGLFLKELMGKAKNHWQKFLISNKFFISQLFLILLAIFLMSGFSSPLYSLIPGFSSLQYPWRFLVWVQFALPFLLLFVINQINFSKKDVFLLIFLFLLLVYRVPQLYGKNYAQLSEEKFYFNQANLHSQNFNTVWSANSQSYPVKTVQAALIEGDGDLEIIETKNASRKYKLLAKSKVKLVDYTFYFPGWKVLANGQELTIEFQDPEYRGLITYSVDPGEYLLELEYQSTNLRFFAQLMSALAILAFVGWTYVVLKKIN